MAKRYSELTAQERQAELAAVRARFEELKAQDLHLDMSRGKPGRQQLDLVSDMLTTLQTPVDCVADGLDVRNYGELTGIPAAKRLFADILGCKAEEDRKSVV